ncbi:S-adenosyl-L-methionine-dependent methyltransferase [Aspergillus karnatakaensis]|uniref:class I SAM-dependent methyltransferase n=1 Tax=Aspergillus karnatakaensis TaxID=1810916 RepID=UPI003CCD5B59
MAADLTENNRKHFDKVASNHQSDFGTLIQQAIKELQARRLWISPKWTDTAPDAEIRLLDYACGAGTVSKALAPYTTQTAGLDLSANMITEYNNAVEELGLDSSRMQGYQYDLLADTNTNSTLPDGALAGKFDVIAIGMALHHVSDPAALLRRFASLLKPGGVCVVLERVPGRDTEPGLEEVLEAEQLSVMKTIAKHGFTEEEMRGLYEQAGMGKGFEYVVIEEPFRFTMFGNQFGTTGFLTRGEVV